MLQASGSDSGVFVVFPLTLLVQNTRPCIPQPYGTMTRVRCLCADSEFLSVGLMAKGDRPSLPLRVMEKIAEP